MRGEKQVHATLRTSKFNCQYLFSMKNTFTTSAIWTIVCVCVCVFHLKALNAFKYLGALEQKETLSQKRVLSSRCSDKNIWVTATAASVLSVWMTCPELTSTHPQICHGGLTGKRNQNKKALECLCNNFYLTKESFYLQAVQFFFFFKWIRCLTLSF